ncbi:hypothetical protein XELAEV_18034228mg [Xenopus laevis]|uniref:Uncharacterized protein n=1 Tax=Xenopus laevis TaxID=8355 RepID=A0A974CEQ7_XENLA|nr:hypothetical protein XELAEV_18034228mg [Xenopus laevis]
MGAAIQTFYIFVLLLGVLLGLWGAVISSEGWLHSENRHTLIVSYFIKNINIILHIWMKKSDCCIDRKDPHRV